MLALWKKSYDQPRQKIKKQNVKLPTKFCLVRTMVFPVVMYECESWTIKKLSTKELVLLNCGVGEDLIVPWTAGRSNQSILKEISPEYSLEGLMVKLKVQYFGHLMGRTDSLEKTGKSEGRGEGDNKVWDGWMASPTKWTWIWVNSRCWWWTAKPGMLQSIGSQRARHDWATELNFFSFFSPFSLFCSLYKSINYFVCFWL